MKEKAKELSDLLWKRFSDLDVQQVDFAKKLRNITNLKLSYCQELVSSYLNDGFYFKISIYESRAANINVERLSQFCSIMEIPEDAKEIRILRTLNPKLVYPPQKRL